MTQVPPGVPYGNPDRQEGWGVPAASPGQWPAGTGAAAPPSAVPPPPRRVDWRRIAWLGGLIAFIALCGIAMLIYVGYQIGPVAFGVGFAAAVLPVPLIVLAFLWLDRYEPEPVVYLVLMFVWGAFVATLVSALVEAGAAVLLRRAGLPAALLAVLVAPLIEETSKALGPILLFWRRRQAFSGYVDGIVYCGLSATGFAMVENILYLGGLGYAANADQGGPAAGIRGLVAVFILRIALGGFAHPLFTAMTGIGLGIAARTRDRRVRWMAPLSGLLAAMIMHGAWNLMPTLARETSQPLILLYGYFSVMMPIFLAMVAFATWLRGYEARLTQRILPEYVRAGWLSPPEVATLATISRRLSARRWAKRVAGDAGAAAMRGYQFAATQLTLLRDRMQRGLDLPVGREASLAEEHRLLAALTGYRAVYAGRDPVAPRAFWDGGQYRVAFPDGVVRTFQAPHQPVVPVPVLLGPPPAAAAGGGWPGAPGGQPPGVPGTAPPDRL